MEAHRPEGRKVGLASDASHIVEYSLRHVTDKETKINDSPDHFESEESFAINGFLNDVHSI
jgi:hypothetical protein